MSSNYPNSGNSGSKDPTGGYKKNNNSPKVNGSKENPAEKPELGRNSSDSKEKRPYERMEDRMKDTYRNFRESEFYQYASSNKEQTVTYILLAIGLILLFVYTVLGGLIVGGVAGYHFSRQIVFYLRNIGQIFEGQDQLRYIVLTALLLALLIAAPAIIIGAAIVGVFRELVVRRKTLD